MWLLLAFIAVPLIEIALFIQVGGAIGLWPTLAIVILTALIGTALLRRQGLQELDRLRASLRGAGDPSEPLIHGALILFAGALLLTPGFFTDAVGFALLLPPVRARIVAQIRWRITVHEMGSPRPHPERPDIIEGEYEPLDVERHGPSGWTRH
jgi:UPF0716 protein FxsA